MVATYFCADGVDVLVLLWVAEHHDDEQEDKQSTQDFPNQIRFWLSWGQHITLWMRSVWITTLSLITIVTLSLILWWNNLAVLLGLSSLLGICSDLV